MKNYIKKLFAIGILLVICASCERNNDLTTLQKVDFSAAIQASPSELILSSNNANESVVTISWPEVNFPVKAPVTYTIFFDVTSDVSWANAIKIEAGTDVLSKSFEGIDLNKMAVKLGLTPGVKGSLVVKVQAYLDRNVYSNVLDLPITPYIKSVVFGEVYVTGAYQDWDVTTSAALSAIDGGVYQGYITFPTDKGLGFKINTQRNWNQFYGADANNNLKDMSDTDLAQAKAGTYQMTVNLNTLKWNVVPYSWGVIGDATAGSWDNSTNMTYDHKLKIWKFTGPLKVGNIKFRLNNTWTVNYGPKNNTDGIMYFDNQGSHYIGEAGNYEITFSIQEKDPTSGAYPPTAIYTVKKI